MGKKEGGTKWPHPNVVILGFAFQLLFDGFSTAQFYLALYFGYLGNLSLTLIYVFLALGVPFGPVVVRRVGPRLTLFVGAAAYTAFLATLISPVSWVVYLASAVMGLGGALLWIAQGTLLTICSTKETRGLNSGVFWGLFQVNAITGSLVSHFLVVAFEPWILFSAFTVFAGCGTLMLLCLRPLPESVSNTGETAPLSSDENASLTMTLNRGEEGTNESAANDFESVRGKGRGNMRDPVSFLESIGSEVASKLRVMWRLSKQREGLLLWPIVMATGLELSFCTSAFPGRLHANDVGLVMMVYGIGEVVGAFLIGRWSDRVGLILGMVTAVFTFTAGLAWGGGMSLSSSGVGDFADFPMGSLAGCALLLGFGDASMNVIIQASIGEMFQRTAVSGGSDVTAEAFAAMQLFQKIGSVCGFIWLSTAYSVDPKGTFEQICFTAFAAVGIGAAFFVFLPLRARHSTPTLQQ